MVDVVTVIAVVIAVAGVVGSLVPLVPGPLLSLVGVYLYWWGTGFLSPGPLLLVGFTVFGLGAVAVDYLAGAVGARAGGASTGTSIVAAVVGVGLLFVFGPLGIVAGVGLTVFVIEYYRGADPRESARAAAFSAVSVLGSALVQVVLTGTMLLGLLAVVVFG